MVVIPTDDDFNGESEEAFTVDFSGDAPTVEFTMSEETPAQQHNRTGCKVLHVKMRREALCELIEKKTAVGRRYYRLPMSREALPRYL